MSDLVCPKCHGPMRSYERSGVHVDQCTDCRGIFLDRGELEHLIDAETAFAARSAPPAPAPSGPLPPAPEPGFGMPRRGWDRDWSHDDSYDGYGRRPRKRRKSFLEELFD